MSTKLRNAYVPAYSYQAEGAVHASAAHHIALCKWLAAWECGGMKLSEADLSRVVEMAWEDRTPFESIEAQFGLNESGVVALMRSHMKASSFRMWRKRMAGRVTKHRDLRSPDVERHRAKHTRQA